MTQLWNYKSQLQQCRQAMEIMSNYPFNIDDETEIDVQGEIRTCELKLNSLILRASKPNNDAAAELLLVNELRALEPDICNLGDLIAQWMDGRKINSMIQSQTIHLKTASCINKTTDILDEQEMHAQRTETHRGNKSEDE